MVYHAGKVECLLNCPNCDKELLDEDVAFCPNCGKPLKTKSRSSDYVLVAAILTIIAAAFCAGLGYVAIFQYTQYTAYYGPEAEFLGFLIFGIPDIIASAVALAGAILMLKRKFIIFSMLGAIISLVSTIITFMTIYLYMSIAARAALFTETMLLSEISIIIFSILSGILVLKSKKEFA
jgi:hypothetical protein